MNNSETHKTKGSELFKLDQFSEAEKFYSLAVDSFPHIHICATLYNNRAAAKLKDGNHHGCTEDCIFVLQLIDDWLYFTATWSNNNLKDQALLRRASAYDTMEKMKNIIVQKMTIKS